MFREWNPPNRFNPREIDWEVPPPKARLEITEDDTRSIVVHNASRAYGFAWSVNPYRGCTHACAYCYAREHHEFLDLGGGTDFERRIAVKHRAPALLRKTLMRKSWKGELIFFSGVTDCYQPLERRFGLTRACLEVCAEFRNPVGILTRSPLILRDLDVLRRLNAHGAVSVSVSIPIVDGRFCRAIEPGAPSPAARLRAVEALAEAGIPVGISLMPMIPGINDATIPHTLKAGREVGARWAWTGLLKLPGPVEAVFTNRIREALPDRAEMVLKRYRRALRGDASWKATLQMFRIWHAKLGYGEMPKPPEPTPFQRAGETEQLRLW